MIHTKPYMAAIQPHPKQTSIYGNLAASPYIPKIH